jgi:hypothetical protein
MRPPPPREEWDFESLCHDLSGKTPEEKLEINSTLYSCFAYEYARSLPHVLRAFRSDRRANRRMGGGVWQCFLPEISIESFSTDWDELEYFPKLASLKIIAPAGFPEVPFLSLESKPRNLPFEELLRSEPVIPITEHDGIFYGDNGHAYPHTGVAHLHIDWHSSDDAIVRSFRSWLERNRPSPPLPLQGKSLRRELEAHLKALGVWRLLQAFDRDVNKAAEYCQKTAGKTPFVRPEDWRASSARAEKILADFSRREVCG